MRPFEANKKEKTVIGMVHLPPLPGTPFYEEGSYKYVFEKAIGDATALYHGGATGCLVQTIDRVYPTGDEADPARVAAVANIVYAIARATGPEFGIGVQILRNALSASLAVATVSGGSFVRCAALVGATRSSGGVLQGDPLSVMQYRRRVGAMHVRMIAEIHSMHYKALDGTPPGETAQAAVRAGADAVSLGDPDEETTLQMIGGVRGAVPGTPVFLAGYTNHENAGRLLAAADGAFVGSCLEKGEWGSEVDEERVRAYMDVVRNIEQDASKAGGNS